MEEELKKHPKPTFIIGICLSLELKNMPELVRTLLLMLWRKYHENMLLSNKKSVKLICRRRINLVIELAYHVWKNTNKMHIHFGLCRQTCYTMNFYGGPPSKIS